MEKFQIPMHYCPVKIELEKRKREAKSFPFVVRLELPHNKLT